MNKDKIRTYASFNKELLYPDYVLSYKFNTNPDITIQDKTLTRIQDDKKIKMYTPNSDKQNTYLDWLMIRATIKDISEFINKAGGFSG